MSPDFDPRYVGNHIQNTLRRIEHTQGDDFIAKQSAELKRELKHETIASLAENFAFHQVGNGEKADHISSLYYAAFVLGNALYVNTLNTRQSQSFWDRTEELAEVVQYTNAANEAGDTLPPNAIGDMIIRRYWDEASQQAQLIASSNTDENAVIEAVMPHYVTPDSKAERHMFRFGVGLIKQLSDLSLDGPEAPIAGVNLGDADIQRATLESFFSHPRMVAFQENPEVSQIPDLLRTLINDMNNDPILEVVHRKGADLYIAPGSYFLITDMRNNVHKFHKLQDSWRLHGVFSGFANTVIPRQDDMSAITTSVGIDDVANMHEFGLYLELERPRLLDPTGSEITLSKSQHVLIPYNYSGQSILAAR